MPMVRAAVSKKRSNEADRYYEAYGRTIDSGIPLPELPSVVPSADRPVAWTVDVTPALTIAADVQWHVLWRTPAQEAWVITGATDDVRYFRCTRFADFEVSSGRIVVSPRGFARPDTIRHLLLDQILPLALASQGELVLHAAAISVGAETSVVLCGCAGAGKSTLAAALSRAGLAATADDGVLVQFADAVRIAPSYPGLRLWPDAAAAAGYRVTALDDVAEYASKCRVPVPQPSDARARRLGAVYVIQPGPVLSFEALSGAAAIRAILEHAFRSDLREPRGLCRGLNAAVRLASSVPIWTVRVPRDLSRVDAAAIEVARHAAGECQDPPRSTARSLSRMVD
jgi:energy-coupling factor transporter ATP-binding protein EcfA2